MSKFVLPEGCAPKPKSIASIQFEFHATVFHNSSPLSAPFVPQFFNYVQIPNLILSFYKGVLSLSLSLSTSKLDILSTLLSILIVKVLQYEVLKARSCIVCELGLFVAWPQFLSSNPYIQCYSAIVPKKVSNA